MVKSLFKALILCTFLTCLGSQAFAGGWPKPIADLWFLDAKGAIHNVGMIESEERTNWDEVNAALAILNKNPGAVVTPEYHMYRAGAVAIGAPAGFMTLDEMKEDAARYRALSPEQQAQEQAERSRKARAMQANPWVWLLQPQSHAEDNCMSTTLTKKKYSGCGDPFQNGLQANEMACYLGKTHVRCQVECREKLAAVKLGYTVGPCAQR